MNTNPGYSGPNSVNSLIRIDKVQANETIGLWFPYDDNRFAESGSDVIIIIVIITECERSNRWE